MFQPYPISRYSNTYARRIWFSGFGIPRGVTLTTTANLRPDLNHKHSDPWKLLTSVCRGASAALEQFPRLNYFTFWGRLFWAGKPERVTVILENSDFSCDLVLLKAAHKLTTDDILRSLKDRGEPVIPSRTRLFLSEHFPFSLYLMERLTGHYRRDYCLNNGPLFISMLGEPDIEDIAYTPEHSMALYPGWPKNGTMKLTLCFNHQLANARPVAKFLTAIKSSLE